MEIEFTVMDFFPNLKLLTATTILALCVAFLFAVIRSSGGNFSNKKKRYHPITGTILNQLINFHRLHHYMTDLATKHQSFRLFGLFRSEVYTALTLQTSSTFSKQISQTMARDGFFTVDGEKRKHQRKIASYQFLTKMLRDFSTSVFKTNSVKLARVVPEAAISNQVVDLKDLFMKSTLETVFKIILGVELESMCGSDEEATRFSDAFDEMKKGDILSRLTELGEKDVKYIRDMILSYIIAGKDTTATTLSCFIYLLCKHLSIQEKIAKEVREATNLKENSSVNELAAGLTKEALGKMRYLLAALTETLRLYPAVLVDGKRRCCGTPALCHGRMKLLWGDDAENLRPERWRGENGVFHPDSPFKFTAFQAGPRTCLGEGFCLRTDEVLSGRASGELQIQVE